MKKLITTTNIVFFLWGLLLIAVSQMYREYTRYYLYLSIAVIIPFLIVKLVKQSREDKINGTAELQLSIYSILTSAVILGILFFIIYKLN